ncbi:uncharacterized protein LOC118143790 isoform X1 [Callithrix jacchus]|uniref:uncharacterized protein LOC118143790 isoform X1 n=1 Tax=Callithrix jacchus TaxID=9483 RepID=UPI0023DD1EFC|nr:uncharacterized protein LOC118143790 isoform X1 [Callithrix jacchus]
MVLEATTTKKLIPQYSFKTYFPSLTEVSEHDLLGRCTLQSGCGPGAGLADTSRLVSGRRQGAVTITLSKCPPTFRRQKVTLWFQGLGEWHDPETDKDATSQAQNSTERDGVDRTSPLPGARGKTSGGLHPRSHTEGPRISSKLRPGTSAPAETRAPSEVGTCCVQNKTRDKKKTNKDEAVVKGLGITVLTFPRSPHSTGCRGRSLPTGSAHARKHRPTGSGFASRPYPACQRPPDQSSANPPLTHSFPELPLVQQSHSQDWLESATSPRPRRVAWTRFPPNSSTRARWDGGP